MGDNHIAIVGGTGFESLPAEIYAEPISIHTRYGSVDLLSVSDNYTEPQKLFFLSRHGSDHSIAPHQINVRANIAALMELGVGTVLATNAVGSLHHHLAPGTLVLFDDFIDMTRGRDLTFFMQGDSWRHVDFSVPYSEMARNSVLRAAIALGIPVNPTGTYVCCDGPRFESPAEIRMFAQLGGHVVGMTGLPEAIMAREAGLDYAGLGIVTNFGAGLTSAPVEHAAVVALMADQIAQVRELLIAAASHVTTRLM